MLLCLSDDVRECYTQAKACARKASDESERHVRQSFLDTAEGWLALARRLAESQVQFDC
jgi:hypothetical protein